MSAAPTISPPATTPAIDKLNKLLAKWTAERDSLANAQIHGAATRKRQQERDQKLINARNLDTKIGIVAGYRDALATGALPPGLLGVSSLSLMRFEYFLWQAKWPANGYDASIRAVLTRAGITENTYAEKRAQFLALAAPRDLAGDTMLEIKRRENAILPGSVPGYFPTPPAVIDRLIEYAQIVEGDLILEPSAGRGDILDAIRARWDDAVELWCCEINGPLRDLLELKGYRLAERIGSDFLDGGPYDQDPRFDRIIGNPPFERGQDMAHIRRAYDWLAPGGALVMICSEGAFFRNDQQAVMFRLWLSEVGAETEKLPQDAFKLSGTNVGTRIVIIAK